jgi:protein-tyrosine kinase
MAATKKGPLNQLLKQADSLTSLLGSLLSASQGRAIRSLMVSSGRNREGKTTTAMTMAIALARHANARVLLVDANFRRPALAELIGKPRTPGLREWLRGEKLAEVVHGTEQPGLSVLTAGSTGSAAEPLSKLPERMTQLTEAYDYVILDGDSVLTSSEAALLAREVDGTVLVAECEKTKWELVALCHDKLSKLGANVIGTVLNKRQYYIPGVFYGKV